VRLNPSFTVPLVLWGLCSGLAAVFSLGEGEEGPEMAAGELRVEIAELRGRLA